MRSRLWRRRKAKKLINAMAHLPIAIATNYRSSARTVSIARHASTYAVAMSFHQQRRLIMIRRLAVATTNCALRIRMMGPLATLSAAPTSRQRAAASTSLADLALMGKRTTMGLWNVAKPTEGESPHISCTIHLRARTSFFHFP